MSESILFSSIRVANNAIYDTNLSSNIDNPIIIDKNRIGINTTATDELFIFTVNGDIKITSNIDASNLTYSVSNLERLIIDTSNAVEIIQRGNKDFIKMPFIQSSIDSHGNIGIGTNLPREALYVHGLVVASNVQFVGQSTLTYSDIYAPPINTVFIYDKTSNIFDFGITGNIKLTSENTIVHQNGFKLSYSSNGQNDYTVIYNYNSNSDITECKVILTLDKYYEGIIDVTVTPEYVDTDIRKDFPAIIFQEILTSEWSSNIDIYAFSNIGININDSSYHLHVNDTIYSQFVNSPLINVNNISDDILHTYNINVYEYAYVRNTLSNLSNISIIEGDLILDGESATINNLINLENTFSISNVYLNDKVLFTNIETISIGFNTSNNAIAYPVGVGTSITSNSLTINGNINTSNIFKNNSLYTIDSQWKNNTGIYFNTGLVTIGESNISKNVNIYGHFITSNLNINTTNSSNQLNVAGEVVISNNIISNSLTGMIAYFAGTTPQVGWLECNGNYISSNIYNSLYNVVGSNFGISNEFFRLPDLRGEFIRGYNIDRQIGSFQSNAIQSHQHELNATKINLAINDTTSNIISGIGINTSLIGFVNYGATSSETRPRNIALLPCIKI
jgi:microcystin-dependent protein